ncbi:MAG: ATP phosphoribosyltransferase regulatory subunit [Dehalococcoidia bacterium]|nr:MAG: ATP phosphoribosyltransferase regulatory subunit [Dehalococcoidia bacterium]
MNEAATSQHARGMRDLLPDEMDRVRRVEDAFAAACRAWGYREVRTPVVEPLHLFTSAGTLSPQTLEGVYSFLDWDGWSGERVVLRPDSTIPAARLYSEQLDGGRTAKLFYTQNIFHFTADGSSREEWQCGVELIGDTGSSGDVELALLALETLRPLSLHDITVRLSHAGIVRGVLAAAGLSPEEQSAAYDRLLDADLTVVDEVEVRLPQLTAPLRLLFEVEGEGAAYITNLREPLTSAIPALAPALDELLFVVRALEARGVTVHVETVLARRFEYYSGIVLKIMAAGQRIVAGGRYDELIGLVGGKRVPASGFALYLAPLVELLPAPAPRADRRIVVRAEAATPELVAMVYDAAARLRAAGLHVESVAGADSAPTDRLTCRAAPPRFALTGSAGERQFDALDDVVRELEQSR